MNTSKRDKGDTLPTQSRSLLYQTEDGHQRIEVRLEEPGGDWL